ncbi:MAG TPA: hypothetical protein VNN06_13010 [Ramlibacter sp.]|nr:hypothetical protein [Ramlibacter sp.]
MQTVELKLAKWRTLYSELNDARLRLREARARRPAGNAVTAELEERVRRLQDESNAALDAVHAALTSQAPPVGKPD